MELPKANADAQPGSLLKSENELSTAKEAFGKIELNMLRDQQMFARLYGGDESSQGLASHENAESEISDLNGPQDRLPFAAAGSELGQGAMVATVMESRQSDVSALRLIDEISQQVEYLLASKDFTQAESPEMRFKLNHQLFIDTDLILSFDRDRWLLRVKSQDRRAVQAMQGGVDKLQSQFEAAGLGSVAVEYD